MRLPHAVNVNVMSGNAAMLDCGGSARKREVSCREDATIRGVGVPKNASQRYVAAADGQLLREFMATQPRCMVAMDLRAFAKCWSGELIMLSLDSGLIAPSQA